MTTLTIEIPKNVLERKTSRRLLVVDPKEFESELRDRWENEDARAASRVARREWKTGKAKLVLDLKTMMR